MDLAVGAAVFLLLYGNLVLPALPRWWELVANPAVAAGFVALARADGLSWEALGFGADAVIPGLRWGGAIVALVAAGVGVVVATRGGRRLLEDPRFSTITRPQLALEVLVRIPLATVLLEEIAFRGVLHAAFDRAGGTAAAVIGSAAAFGAWHVVTTLRTLRLRRTGGSQTLLVMLAVIGTSAAGVLLSFLRIETGGIVGPFLAHAAVNALAALAARQSSSTLTRSM